MVYIRFQVLGKVSQGPFQPVLLQVEPGHPQVGFVGEKGRGQPAVFEGHLKFGVRDVVVCFQNRRKQRLSQRKPRQTSNRLKVAKIPFGKQRGAGIPGSRIPRR